MSRRTNNLPDLTTIAKKFNFPSIDNRSAFVQVRREHHFGRRASISLVFSGGMEMVMETVSMFMPRYTRLVEGPTNLSDATGMLRYSKTERKEERSFRACRKSHMENRR